LSLGIYLTLWTLLTVTLYERMAKKFISPNLRHSRLAVNYYNAVIVAENQLRFVILAALFVYAFRVNGYNVQN